MKDSIIKKIFKESTYIIIDSREKDTFIRECFDKFNIKYKIDKMEYGDYGIEIEENKELGINETIRFPVSIERKMGLNEIGTNITRSKDRFEREMKRCNDNNGYMIIMIENAAYSDIVNKKYPNNITPKQFLALLHSISVRYGVAFMFIEKEHSALFVYNTLKYYAKNKLKQL